MSEQGDESGNFALAEGGRDGKIVEENLLEAREESKVWRRGAREI